MEDIASVVRRASRPDAASPDRADAFAEIVRRFQDMAVGYAHGPLGDFQLAEDAAQEAFVEAWRLLDRLDHPAAFPSWFRRLVHTRCTRLTRGKRPPLVGLDHAMELASPEAAPGDRLSEEEDRAQLHAALHALSTSERVTTTLYYISGYTQAEVAEFLGIPVGTVKYRLHTARKRLREEVLAMVGSRLQAAAPSRDDAFAARIGALVQPTTMRSGLYHHGVEPVDGPDGWLLMRASAAGDLHEMARLLASDPALVHVERWYQMPIHFAVREGHANAVRLLLDHGAEPGFSRLWEVYGWPHLRRESHRRGYGDVQEVLTTALRDRHGYHVRHDSLKQAVASGDRAAIQVILDAHPNAIHMADEDGEGPLHWAVGAGSIALVAHIADLGADIEKRRSDGCTPLLLALRSVPGNMHDRLSMTHSAVRNHGALIGLLLGRGAEYVLSVACALGDKSRVSELLGADPGLAGRLDSSRRSPLSHAAQWGHVDVVKALLDAGADPNQPEWGAPRGNALFEAAAHNHVAIARLLLAAGADANASKESSGTCLTIAEHGHPDHCAAMQTLLRHHGAHTPTFAMSPADLRLSLETDDPIIYTGEQFVHQIFGAGDLPALRLLLERHPDALRCLPLCGSMYPRWRDGLELLFAFGFGPDLRDWLGKTMLHCAAMENDVEAAALMLERGADINAVEAEDRATPLAMAARRGHEEMVIFLLERGADAGLPAEEWARPATVARDGGHEEIASLIARSPV